MLSRFNSQFQFSTALLVAAMALTGLVNAQEFAAGHIFASSRDNHEIVEYDADGNRLRTFGGGSGLSNPYGLAFGPNGHLYVASYGNDAIVEFDATGVGVKTISGVGLDGPYALAFGPNGNLFVTCYDSDHLVELTPLGTVVKDMPLPYTDQPTGVMISPEGNIYVTGDNSANIVELDPEGVHLRVLPVSIASCRGIAWMGDGNLLVGGYSSGRKILKVSLTGTIVDSWLSGSTSLIYGIAVGPDGHVYATANNSDKIYATDAVSHDVETLTGGGASEKLVGLAFAPQRFDAKIVGKRALQGQDPKSITESCVVSMSPFASWAMIQLKDDVANPLDLTTFFGSDAIVLQGRNIAGSKVEKQQFIGAQAGRKVVDAGMATALWSVQLLSSDSGFYSVKRVTGPICRDSGDGAFAGKVMTGKKLN